MLQSPQIPALTEQESVKTNSAGKQMSSTPVLAGDPSQFSGGTGEDRPNAVISICQIARGRGSAILLHFQVATGTTGNAGFETISVPDIRAVPPCGGLCEAEGLIIAICVD
jgi:hypothetical protein